MLRLLEALFRLLDWQWENSLIFSEVRLLKLILLLAELLHLQALHLYLLFHGQLRHHPCPFLLVYLQELLFLLGHRHVQESEGICEEAVLDLIVQGGICCKARRMVHLQ